MSTKIGQISQRTKELLDLFDDIGENLLLRGGSDARNTPGAPSPVRNVPPSQRSPIRYPLPS